MTAALGALLWSAYGGVSNWFSPWCRHPKSSVHHLLLQLISLTSRVQTKPVATTASGSAPKDPELANIGTVTTPVEVGNTLTVSSEFADTAPLEIRWQQSFRERSDTYYQVAYTNTSKSNAKYYLFISSGKLEDFRKLDTANGAEGKITFNVTADFQYGQKDKSGKNRFLVYHERDRAIIMQHRFVAAAWLRYGNMAGGFIDNLPGGLDATKMLETMNKYVAP
ncbi:hypothetical protein MMC26_004739 [Xylographa opegraphella]|nr:hypothetical protein [Xylographa opegraphella]